MKRSLAFLLLMLSCVASIGVAGCTDPQNDADMANPDGIWTRVVPVGDVPSPRQDFGMVYDPVDNKVIVFGGYLDITDQSGRRFVQLNDTWVYDPRANAWTELHPSGDAPPARSGCSLAYDSTRRRVILFGGRDDAAEPMSLSDTWAFDPARDTWTDLESDHPESGGPFGRYGFSMIYAPGVDKVILFGGLGSFPGDAVFVHDPAANAWTTGSPAGVPVSGLPGSRYGGSLVYDAASGKVILLGGYDDSSVGDGPYRPVYFCDAWTYDPVTSNWTELQASGDPPHGRSFGVLPLVHDTARNRVVMFGGWRGDVYRPDEPEASDTWAYDLTTNSWTPLYTTGDLPDGTWGGFMVYDSADDAVLLFGNDWSLYKYVANPLPQSGP